MTGFTLDRALREGLERFIADRDRPPATRMSEEQAINVIVGDWLMGQGYMPFPDDEQGITTALEAADVPRT